MNENFGIVIMCTAILFLCFVGTALATNWSVDGSGGADFTGIQDVINNAKEGDTILVYSGIYYENVVVDKSVTLKGIGHPIVDAGGKGNAITFSADGITVEGFNVTNSRSSRSDVGIKVTSNNNTITGNNVSNNSGGILLYDSRNNIITGNTFVSGGLSVRGSFQNTVEDNTVNGKPLVYLEDVSNYKIEDAGQVILANCSNIRVENLDLSNTSVGIDLWDTEDSTISNNKVCDNSGGGIYLSYSSNNTITGNSASNNRYGIGLYHSSNNTITGNNASNNYYDGIYLSYSSNNNTITGNNVCNNKHEGIYLSHSSNNTISGNNVSNNNEEGIDLDDSSNNTLTGNNVSNNNEEGIHLHYSSNNTLTGNNVSNNNEEGIRLYDSRNNIITGNTFVNDGLFVRNSFQNTVEENTVNGKPLVYLEDASNYKIEDAGQVILVNCSNIRVKNLDLSNTSVGIELWDTEDSTISNNKVCNNSGGGIDLSSSSNNNTITGNNVSSNKDEGIFLYDSNNNTITGNNLSNNDDYFNLWYSSNNIFYRNNFINNTDNFSDWEGETEEIDEEIVKEGIRVVIEGVKEAVKELLESIGISHGNLGSANTWNSTEKITYTYNGSTYTNYLGNYWHDYEEKYPDAEETDSTGIWDTPYILKRDMDIYPLMERFENYSITKRM